MEQQKRYGHFDDQHREYVITDPQTPWPWINYLGNEDFFSYRWTTVDATSTSRTVIPCGTRDGNPVRPHSTSMSAVMV